MSLDDTRRATVILLDLAEAMSDLRPVLIPRLRRPALSRLEQEATQRVTEALRDLIQLMADR